MRLTDRLGLPIPENSDAASMEDSVGPLGDAIDAKVAVDDQGVLSARPAAGTVGRYYFATDTAQLFRDTGTVWVEIPTGVAAGAITADYKTSARRTDHGVLGGGKFAWLLCDGRAVSRTTYAALFAEIGIDFGAGNGSTTFNLPDAVGRVAVNEDPTGIRITTAAGRDRGESGGEDKHVLTIPETPAHAHAIPVTNNQPGVGGLSELQEAPGGANLTGTTRSTGGGGAHNNMQPYVVAGNLFIRA